MRNKREKTKGFCPDCFSEGSIQWMNLIPYLTPMKKLNISQIDTFFTNGSYAIEFLIYFRHGIKTKNIRSALRTLYSVFWPVFGEYNDGIIQFNKYYEEKYFDETGNETGFNPADPAGVIQDKYQNTIPAYSDRLFFLKIIQHKNGTVLIPRMNHLAGDGYSYFYFLSALAATSHSSPVPFKKYLLARLYKPAHRRTVLKDFRFEEQGLEPSKPTGKLSVTFELVSRAAIRNTIKEISSRFNQTVSTNDILSAMVVRNILNVQKDFRGEEFQLTIPIDVRRHIGEYGSRYFGNPLMFGVKNFKTDEIENSKTENIAIDIRKSLPVITRDSYLEYIEHIETLIRKKHSAALRPFDPEKGCLVTNLSQLHAGRLNFGTGSPDFIFPLTIEKNSVAIMADKNNFIIKSAY
jgi:hypothetical protein